MAYLSRRYSNGRYRYSSKGYSSGRVASGYRRNYSKPYGYRSGRISSRGWKSFRGRTSGYSNRSKYSKSGYPRRGGSAGVSASDAVEKVVVRTVKPSDQTEAYPDSLGINGFRARVTWLTDPAVASQKIDQFTGNASYVGVTCNTTYELSSGGPFVHRRVLFKSSFPWPVTQLGNGVSNSAGGISPGEYVRPVAESLSDQLTTQCLRRLFVRDTVRGVLDGPVQSVGITVLRDETFNMSGKEDGARRRRKYWNSLKSEPVMRYTLEPNGSFSRALMNPVASQHIYVADIFSYGLLNLDCSLPGQKTPSAGHPFGAKEDPSSQGRPAKRSKSDESVSSLDWEMTGINLGSSGAREKLSDPMAAGEDREEAVARIVTELKVYLKNAKV